MSSEQRVTSNEQKVTNNEQNVTSNEQVSPPQKVKDANQVEIRFQNHACLFTFYHSQYICILIYNV